MGSLYLLATLQYAEQLQAQTKQRTDTWSVFSIGNKEKAKWSKQLQHKVPHR